MSAPYSKGRNRKGEAKVLSIIKGTLACFARDENFSNPRLEAGLPIVSAYIPFVFSLSSFFRM
jgi:hypothetical protein